MSTTTTTNEQRLLGLCRRLLSHNEQLHARIDRLHGTIRWLGTEYLSLRAEVDRIEQAHTATDEAAETFPKAALDDLGD